MIGIRGWPGAMAWRNWMAMTRRHLALACTALSAIVLAVFIVSTIGLELHVCAFGYAIPYWARSDAFGAGLATSFWAAAIMGWPLAALGIWFGAQKRAGKSGAVAIHLAACIVAVAWGLAWIGLVAIFWPAVVCGLGF